MSKHKGSTDLRTEESYDPEQLLNYIKLKYNLQYDKDLMPFLGVHPSAVTRLRDKSRPFCASIVLNVHETTGISLKEIRSLLGVPYAVF